MEIRQYLFLLRRWAWLLIVGALIGGVASYFVSSRQPEVYQTSTKVMVMQAPETQANALQGYTYYYDVQLAKTYSQLIATQPVMQLLSKKLGFAVSSGQISVKQVSETLVLEIIVKDGDPQRAAQIANALVDVFIAYNVSLQSERFASAEASLQAQITQVEGQIAALQAEMQNMSQQTLTTQQEQLEAKLASLQEEIVALKVEIAALPPTTTPATAQRLAEKQAHLEQLQSMYNLYQQAYSSLLVLGSPVNNNDQNLRLNQVQTTLALYQQIYTGLLSNYESIKLARLRSTPNVVQIEPAHVPTAPIQPQPLRDAGLGSAVGLLIMGMVAFLIEYLDDTIKTPEDVGRLLKLPVIGLIGEMETNNNGAPPSAYVAQQPRSPIAEAYRSLRTNLEFASVDKPLKTLLVTSVAPSEGKTTTAVNLAVSLAQGNKRVTLLDADLRHPMVHRYVDVPNTTGLSDLFRDGQPPVPARCSWGETQVAVIPTGVIPPNPAELLGSARMSQILEELKQTSDIVVIDSPPSIVADPIVLAARVDGVLLVIQPGFTKIEAAQAMLEQLQRAGARVVGVVLNPISRNRSYYYGKYRYYSRYYYDSSQYGHYYTSNNGKGNDNKGLLGRKPKPASPETGNNHSADAL